MTDAGLRRPSRRMGEAGLPRAQPPGWPRPGCGEPGAALNAAISRGLSRLRWAAWLSTMAGVVRTFLQADDLRYFVAEQFGTERQLSALQRLTGGTKKGVYRLGLDDGATVIAYVWADDENYWPPATTVPDDPFTDATGADLFAANHAALSAAGVRVPELILFDRSRQHLDADLALVEDAGSTKLEDLLNGDGDSGGPPLRALGDAVRRMHTTFGPRYGKLAAIANGEAPQARRTEDIIRDRALADLDAAAERDPRLAKARDRIVTHVDQLWEQVRPRQTYALVHGELGPDHVLVSTNDEPVMIDFEGLAYFDVEWDHAWLEMRFGAHYQRLNPVECDPERLEFYRYAQVLSLIEGPLRIATTDFPDRQWMLDLAEWNIAKAFAAVGHSV